MFSHTKVLFESKIAPENCFTIETAVGGCESRRCATAVAAMVAYGWSMGAYARSGPPLGSEIAGGERRNAL